MVTLSKSWIAFFVSLLFVILQPLSSQFNPHSLFSDYAVLQHGTPLKVWGKANPGTEVSVELAGQKSLTYADDEGRWLMLLEPVAIGSLGDMVFKSEGNVVVAHNVMGGEVWFTSGQSNMDWTLANGVDNKDSEIASANYPAIRFFKVPKNTSVIPFEDLPKQSWKVSTPENVLEFSAVSYFFAKKLHQSRNVPVGIINASWGATDIESWMSAEILSTHPDFRDQIEKMDRNPSHWQQKVEQSVAAERNREWVADNSVVGLKINAHKLRCKVDDWSTVEYPANMRKMGYPDYWGLVWMRKKFQMETNKSSDKVALILSVKSKSYRIYLNGNLLDLASNEQGRLNIPTSFLKKGENVLAIRMYVNWGVGELGKDNEEAALLINGKQKIDLSGSWLHNNTIEPTVAQWQNYYVSPTVIFNAMVAPLIPYTIKGVLWYQGENNASRGAQYGELQPLMISDWRVRWKQGYFPFLYVQLANFKARNEQAVEYDTWADFRFHQFTTLARSPYTGMACTIDIGDANNIHPQNKQDVGHRLFLVAQSIAYGENVLASGPVVKRAWLDGNKVWVEFLNVGKGLKTPNKESLEGFALSGNDGQWFWAEAEIQDGYVVVSSDKVPNPVKVQYGWQSNPNCNLYNSADLPGVPFKVSVE